MTLAKQHIDDYEQLTQYIVDLNNAYLSAKSYLGIDWNFCFNKPSLRDVVFTGHTKLTKILLSVWHRKVLKAYCGGFFFLPVSWETRKRAFWKFSPVVTEGRSCPRLHEFCSKSLFPWLQAPICIRSGAIEHPHGCELKLYKYKASICVFRRGEGSQHVKNACEARHIHLFNSGLYSMWWSFYNQLRLSYFPLAFRLFPPWELIRTLASENKNPTILNMIGFRFYIRCTVINSCEELITKVMWSRQST